MLVKICGVTTPAMAAQAAAAGADLVGVVLVESPRRVSPTQARDILRALPPHVCGVAVFRETPADVIEQICRVVQPDRVQVEPSPALAAALGDRLLPVFHDGEALLTKVTAYCEMYRETRDRPLILVEAAGRGGRGVRPDWERVSRLTAHAQVLLAGGLTPSNVGEAIRRVRPHGVDVSSGVERRPGEKDPDRVTRFINNVNGGDHVNPTA